MQEKESFLKNRIKSVGYAFKGAYILITTEASVKVQFFIGMVVTAAGFIFNISMLEWVIQTLIIALIMALEGMNTAIEETANFIHPERHPKIGLIKDIAAGAVFIFAIAAAIIGCLIYIPKML